MDAAPAAAAETADDPFAGAGDGGDDPFANQGGGDDAPPIVDKEGEPVEPGIETQPLPTPEQPAEGGEDPEAAPDPPAAAEAAQGGAGDGGDGDKPKSPMRRYRLLYQTGEMDWREAEWEENGQKTRIVEARNNDHALRLAFSILKEPDDGVTVLPVPDSSFKPRRLKKKAVVPRTALDIS